MAGAEACRICLSHSDESLFYPCRCTAPVHRRCLDSWRTSGMNPANLTRCEVCQYHYRIGQGVGACTVHLVFYCVSFVFYILLFFGLALLFGHVVRVTGIFDVVHWGRLTFIKPETMKGFFFAGICFNFFLIGVVTTIYVFFLLITGRLRQHMDSARRMTGTPWVTGARQKRRRGDCCTDCCHGCKCHQCDLQDACFWFCVFGDRSICCPCEACCGLCDEGCSRCCECNCGGGGGRNCKGCDCGNCNCANCNCDGRCSCECGCGGCDDNPFVLVLLCLMVCLAVCLMVLGMLVLFWLVLVNVMYGIFLHQHFVKEQIARKWPVQAYDPALDPRKSADVETPELTTMPAVPAVPAAPAAPAQEMMSESNNMLPGQIEGTK